MADNGEHVATIGVTVGLFGERSDLLLYDQERLLRRVRLPAQRDDSVAGVSFRPGGGEVWLAIHPILPPAPVVLCSVRLDEGTLTRRFEIPERRSGVGGVSLHWAPDGQRILIASPPRLLLVDVSSGKAEVISQGGNWLPEPETGPGVLASGVLRFVQEENDRRYRVVDRASGQTRVVLNLDQSGAQAGEIAGWSNDGRYVVSILHPAVNVTALGVADTREVATSWRVVDQGSQLRDPVWLAGRLYYVRNLSQLRCWDPATVQANTLLSVGTPPATAGQPGGLVVRVHPPTPP